MMTGIDLAVHMVPDGIDLAALLATVVVGVGSRVDDGKRAEMRSWARLLGAWWINRGGDQAPAPASRATTARTAPPQPTTPRANLR